MKYCTRPTPPQRLCSGLGPGSVRGPRFVSSVHPAGTSPDQAAHQSQRFGSNVWPEHLAATAGSGAAAVSGMTTANVAALTAIVIRLALGQLHRTGRFPTVVAFIPVTWPIALPENHARAPRYVARLHKLVRSVMRGRPSRHGLVTNPVAPAGSGRCYLPQRHV